MCECKLMVIITICFLSSALLFLGIEDLIPKTSLLLIKVKFTIIIITHVHCNRISVIYLSSSFLKTFFCKHHHISYVKENLVIFKKSERLTKTMLGERRSWYEALVDSFDLWEGRGTGKGSHPLPNRMFFYTLSKLPPIDQGQIRSYLV